MLAALLAVLVATPQPSPTPAVTPLKVIERVRSTPFCTALGDNIKHSIETLLADDDAFKQAEPLFEQAANDLEFAGDMESSFNDPHPARSHANARLTFDIAHLRDRATSIVENLKKIDDLLSDAKRFPSAASTDEQRRLLALRDQLLKIAKAQNETLNVITGTAEEYAMDDLFSRDVSANGALSANGAKSPDAGLFQGGPMNAPQATPGAAAASMTLSGAQLNGQFKDPRLQSLAFNNVLGRIYADYVREEQREQKLEASFTPHLLEAARLCKP